LIDLSQINLTVKYRYRQHPVPVEALEVGPTSLRARFSEGQYGISPGQSVVFYAGDYVLGGGIVTSAAFSRMLACV
ncbi:MAG: hypothetical protein LBL67_03030, partial [Coriobacteriales bacterium]|nr:hypothetical protein [Coriobacteriales bacterium]